MYCFTAAHSVSNINVPTIFTGGNGRNGSMEDRMKSMEKRMNKLEDRMNRMEGGSTGKIFVYTICVLIMKSHSHTSLALSMQR